MAGRTPHIKMGSPVAVTDLDALDVVTDHPMPGELRAFYLELGDAFEFVPDDSSESPAGWQATWLSD